MARSDRDSESHIRTLLEFYKDNVAYQRHHEDIRFKGSQLIIAVAGALLATIKIASLGSANYAVGFFIVFLGLLGVVHVLKHTERADRHATIARGYRHAISELGDANATTSVEQIHRLAASNHKQRAGFVYQLRARWMWVLMHIAVIILGVAIVFLQAQGAIK
jgi:hypothetical protein